MRFVSTFVTREVNADPLDGRCMVYLQNNHYFWFQRVFTTFLVKNKKIKNNKIKMIILNN